MEKKNHHHVLIIGSGPAGFTAALYAGRAGLAPRIFEGIQPGGQLTITNDVENYPGFEHGITGPELMDIFRKQAHRFGATSIFRMIVKVDLSKRPFTLWDDSGEIHTSDSVIISTGASAKWMDIPSEQEYKGYGVSACATCDGFFFKNQHVAVVGGGDTAMEEANYLTRHVSKVSVIHRRDEFRASKIMQQRVLNNPKIEVLWDSVVAEVLGKNIDNRKSMTGLRIRNIKTNTLSDLDVTGLFIAIGHQPNSAIFSDQLELNSAGYIVTQPHSTRTNIPGVFAAGDVADPAYRQAVTAAGTGCMAAIDAERFLESEGV